MYLFLCILFSISGKLSLSTHRVNCSCRKCVTIFSMLSIWFGWFSSDIQCLCLSGSAELSLVSSVVILLLEYRVTYSLTFYFCIIFLMRSSIVLFACRRNVNVCWTPCNEGEVQKEEQ